jgi:hypothetical protein
MDEREDIRHRMANRLALVFRACRAPFTRCHSIVLSNRNALNCR